MVVPNICVSLVWNLLKVTLLALRILKQLTFLENLCTLVQKYSNFILHGSTFCARTPNINTLIQSTLEPYISLQCNGGVTQLRNVSDLPSVKQEPAASPPD